MSRNKIFWVFAVLLSVLVIGGWFLSIFFNIDFWHGLYCALAIGATDGCDVNSPSAWGRFVEACVILIAVPTLGYAFTQVTSGHLKKHMDFHHEEIKKLINENNNGDNNVE